MNLSMLKAVQDTFAAVLPTIMNGVQAHVDQAVQGLTDKLDSQKCQIATLARRVALAGGPAGVAGVCTKNKLQR